MNSLLDQIKIVYEDDNLVAINKPAGLLVHSTPGRDDEITLIDWIRDNKSEILQVGEDIARPGIVHRLDRETSGIMIIAKNNKSFEYLKNLFQSREIKKNYLALVFGNFKEKNGIIDKPIGRIASSSKHSTKGKKLKDLKPAVTEYKVIDSWQLINGQFFSLLEVHPKTGRTNQIRVHLASISHSVVGDKVYGSKKLELPNDLKRMFLHAYFLEFLNLNNQMIHLQADLPNDLQEILDFLKKNAQIMGE